MITSPYNPRVRQVVRLNTKARERSRSRSFVAEGRKLFLETPMELLKEVYVSAGEEEGLAADGVLSGVPYETVDDRVFAKMCDTSTPQGILAVVSMPEYTEADLMPDGPSVSLLIEDVQDPGNLGTIMRTAEAAGVGGVWMSRGCADIFNPKTIRATMGSVYRVPFICGADLQEAAVKLKETGTSIAATAPDAGISYREVPRSGRVAFVIGNEGSGVSEDLLSLADLRVSIPMQGQIESLNVAIATAILLFT